MPEIQWTAESIRKLRLQLGWSLSEYSRRLGCHKTLVESWEQGDSEPDKDMTEQLNALHAHLEDNATKISKQPLADLLIKEKGLEQITLTEIDE